MEIKHLRVGLWTFATVTVLFWVVSLSTYQLLKTVVSHSQFRLAVTMNASRFAGQRVTLLVGDSRMMDGINAAVLAGKGSNGVVFNAAFNGVEYPEALAEVEGFVDSCGCHLNKVIIDETALWEESPGVSETEVFLATFLDSAKNRVLVRDPMKGWFLRLFPAIHFNNEVTIRSLYYLMLGRDDQDHGNSYRFRVPKDHVLRIGTERKINQIAVVDIKRLVGLVAKADGKLVVVIPPHHPAYTSGRVGFVEYVESVKRVVEEADALFQDHSRLFSDHPEYFADLIHLHTDGQAAYSQYLAAHILQQESEAVKQ